MTGYLAHNIITVSDGAKALLVAIIMDAIDENDEPYFTSPIFEAHCSWLDFNPAWLQPHIMAKLQPRIMEQIQMRRTIDQLPQEEIRALKTTFPNGITEAEIKEIGEKANIHGMALRSILGMSQPPDSDRPAVVNETTAALDTDAPETFPEAQTMQPKPTTIAMWKKGAETAVAPTFLQPPAPAGDELQQITDLINRIRRIKEDLDGTADIRISGNITLSVVIDLNQNI